MNRVKKLANFILYSNWKEKLIVGHFCILIVSIKFIINFLPLRAYYKRYFLFASEIYLDLQPYSHQISLYKKVKKHCPLQISCLTESMVIHTFFKPKGIIIPIKLGIKTDGKFEAHAWIGNNCFENVFQEIDT